MAIDRKIDDARSIRDTSADDRSIRASLLLVRERSKRLPIHEGFRERAMAIKAKARSRLLASKNR